MGNQKLKWTVEEEAALKAGVAKYGVGKWKNILVDSEFKHKLANRSNVDLKDKWRNMGASASIGQVSGAKAVTPKGKATTTVALPSKTENSPSILVSKDNINDNPPKNPEGSKNGPKYKEMILEALSSIKDRNGSNFGAIMGFIEKKYEVPQSFRRLLSSKLRKLVIKGTVEKVQKRYKIKHASLGARTPSPKQKIKRASLGTKTPSSKQKGVRSKPKQEPRSNIPAEAVEDAAKTAAHKIAEAEYKSFIAAEAVKESERVSQMAEDAYAMLMRLKEIFEQREDEADK